MDENKSSKAEIIEYSRLRRKQNIQDGNKEDMKRPVRRERTPPPFQSLGNTLNLQEYKLKVNPRRCINQASSSNSKCSGMPTLASDI